MSIKILIDMNLSPDWVPVLPKAWLVGRALVHGG